MIGWLIDLRGSSARTYQESSYGVLFRVTASSGAAAGLVLSKDAGHLREWQQRLSDIYTGDEKRFQFFRKPRKLKNDDWPLSEQVSSPARRCWPSSSAALVLQWWTCFPEKQTMTFRLLRLVSGPVTFTSSGNASPHKTRAVLKFFKGEPGSTLPHSAYSLDLIPFNFWLFPLFIEKLANINSHQRVRDIAVKVKKCVIPRRILWRTDP